MNKTGSGKKRQAHGLPPGYTAVSDCDKGYSGVAPAEFLPAAGSCVSAQRAVQDADLRQEAANMLRLASAQEGLQTPLSISSKGAQAVMKQF